MTITRFNLMIDSELYSFMCCEDRGLIHFCISQFQIGMAFKPYQQQVLEDELKDDPELKDKLLSGEVVSFGLVYA